MPLLQEVPQREQQQGQQHPPEKELRAIGDHQQTFQEWLRTTPEPGSFFQQLLLELQQRCIQHYHLRLSNGFDHKRRSPLPGWDVSVRYGQDTGNEEDAGPVDVQRCMFSSGGGGRPGRPLAQPRPAQLITRVPANAHSILLDQLPAPTGNVTERMRLGRVKPASSAPDGDTVVDLYTGIGYYTLPLLVHAGVKKVRT